MESDRWKWLMGIGLASCRLVGSPNLESGVRAVSRQLIVASGGDTGNGWSCGVGCSRRSAESVIGVIRQKLIEAQSGLGLWMRWRSVRSCESASVRL